MALGPWPQSSRRNEEESRKNDRSRTNIHTCCMMMKARIYLLEAGEKPSRIHGVKAA